MWDRRCMCLYSSTSTVHPLGKNFTHSIDNNNVWSCIRLTCKWMLIHTSYCGQHRYIIYLHVPHDPRYSCVWIHIIIVGEVVPCCSRFTVCSRYKNIINGIRLCATTYIVNNVFFMCRMPWVTYTVGNFFYNMGVYLLTAWYTHTHTHTHTYSTMY